MENERTIFDDVGARRRPRPDDDVEDELPAVPPGGLTPFRTFIVVALIIGCFGVIGPRFIYPLVKNVVTGKSANVKNELEDKFLPPRLQNRPPPSERPAGNRDRPLHHPGARFSGEHAVVAESKGSLYFMLPLYTVGIIAFLLFTFYKVISKSGEPERIPRADRIRYNPLAQSFTSTLPNAYRAPREDDQRSPKNPSSTEGGARKVSEFELQELETKLAQTEAQMNALLVQMAAMETLKKQQMDLLARNEQEVAAAADDVDDVDQEPVDEPGQPKEPTTEDVVDIRTGQIENDIHTDEPAMVEEVFGDENQLTECLLTQRKQRRNEVSDTTNQSK